MAGKDSYKYYTSSSVVYEKADDETVNLMFPKRTSLPARLHFKKESLSDDDKLFIEFIASLLQLDPTKRPTAAEALKLPWLEGVENIVIPAMNLTPGSGTVATAAPQAKL